MYVQKSCTTIATSENDLIINHEWLSIRGHFRKSGCDRYHQFCKTVHTYLHAKA